jgi:hypothetical protein
MLFIDADIQFNPMDLLAMVALSEPGGDKDILCALYPKKNIVWSNIKLAVEKELVTDPEALAVYGGSMAFNLLDGTTSFSILDPVEISEGATGFMLIQRDVFDRFKAAYPEAEYKPDHKDSKDFNGDRTITAYFDCKIDPDSKRYLSEDYNFSQMVRKIGVKVWACPWINLTHIGTYGFQGNLSALGALNVQLN